jgi:hypothetical protein
MLHSLIASSIAIVIGAIIAGFIILKRHRNGNYDDDE